MANLCANTSLRRNCASHREAGSATYNVIKPFLSLSFFFVFSFAATFSARSKEDATVIFRDAALYNMTDAGHVWIVTEQALFSNNTPVGTLGLKLNNDNETEHIRVSRFDCFSFPEAE
jgi:hypothetical protein